jgi:ATP-dependent DNA helicase PIF1
MSKKAQSGLGTLKRDFSQSSIPSHSSQPISWPPTPRPPAPRPLSSREQRLKDIQDALAGNPVKSERILTNSSSQVINKRPADSQSALATGQPAKKRILPSDWNDEKRSSSSNVLASSSNNARAPPSSTVSKGSTASASSKQVASVFLSHEQSQILQLVLDGHSVFYTGSAGMDLPRLFSAARPLSFCQERESRSY